MLLLRRRRRTKLLLLSRLLRRWCTKLLLLRDTARRTEPAHGDPSKCSGQVESEPPGAKVFDFPVPGKSISRFGLRCHSLPQT